MDWVKEKMDQARLRLKRIQEHGQAAAPGYRIESKTESTTNRPALLFPTSQKLSWLTVGLVSGVMIVNVAWWIIELGDSSGVDRMEISWSEQLRQPREDLKEGKAASDLSRLEILPPPAAGKDTDRSVNTTSSDLHAITDHLPVASEIQPRETIRDTGPWAINLVSLQHKADAERFLVKANSRGIAAEIDQVTVKGKIYWRVHVSGFSTAAEAGAKASQIKEKLGLKDVWIAKR
jgi:hypothetical protein